jgi:hypothetical protein
VQPSRTNRVHRAARWLLGIAALVLAPKCLLCVAGYIGLGALLGITGPEFCGVASTGAPGWRLPVIGAGLLLVGVILHQFRRAGAGRVKPRRNGRGD